MNHTTFISKRKLNPFIIFPMELIESPIFCAPELGEDGGLQLNIKAYPLGEEKQMELTEGNSINYDFFNIKFLGEEDGLLHFEIGSVAQFFVHEATDKGPPERILYRLPRLVIDNIGEKRYLSFVCDYVRYLEKQQDLF